MSARNVFDGSDAAVTRRYLKTLEARDDGIVAAMLFRAQKASYRAKHYRGSTQDRFGRLRSFREIAYDRKSESLAGLCKILLKFWPAAKWGWGRDPGQPDCPHVLYIELPTGQVSFHSVGRFEGPDFAGEWDHARGTSADRIIQFCDNVMNGCASLIAEPAPF
jgi:hypothetical protein